MTELYELIKMNRSKVSSIAHKLARYVKQTKDIKELFDVVLKNEVRDKEQFCWGFVVGRYTEKHEALMKAIYQVWGDSGGKRSRKSIKRIKKR